MVKPTKWDKLDRAYNFHGKVYMRTHNIQAGAEYDCAFHDLLRYERTRACQLYGKEYEKLTKR